MVAVLVAAILDGVIGLILANIPALELPFQYEVFVSVLVLVWYIMTELGSIVENIGALGAPVPAWLRKAIAALGVHRGRRRGQAGRRTGRRKVNRQTIGNMNAPGACGPRGRCAYLLV